MAQEEKPVEGMLAKGLRLLVALGNHPEGAGVSQLAREVNIPVSSTHRLLTEMIPLRFVRFDPEARRYSLGLRAFEVGQRVTSARRLSDVASSEMHKVTEKTGETTLLAVRVDAETMYVERVESKHLVQIVGSPGQRGWLHCTATGKSLMAFLPDDEMEELLPRLHLERLTPQTITDLDELRQELSRTRERGYAVNNEEQEKCVRAVGVPIINRRDLPVASISLPTLTFRYSMKELEEFVPLLHKAAKEISVQLP